VQPVAQARPSVAGRWSFPPPPWPSTVAGRAFEVFPGVAPHHRPEPAPRKPSWTSSPLQSARRRRGSARAEPSSRGIRLVLALLPTCLPRVHSREPEPPLARWVPPTGSRAVLVVPPHLDGFLRAEEAGLLHPAAGQGFVAFHASPASVHSHVRRRDTHGPHGWRSPRRGSHPSKSSLRRQPHRIAAAVASLPLPSRRSGSTTRLDDAPVRRSGPPRHRARGARHAAGAMWRPPRRTSAVGIDPWPRDESRGRDDVDEEIGPTPGWSPRALHPARTTSEDAAWERRGRNRCANRESASRPPRRTGRGSVESSRSGRLRGLAPSTKFVAVRPPLPATDARSFHGLCSPSRSCRPGRSPIAVRPLRSGGSWPAPGETEISRGGSAGLVARTRRGTADPRNPSAGSPWRRAEAHCHGARRVCPEHGS